MLFQRKKLLVTNPHSGTASVTASTLCPFGQGGTRLADVLALAGCWGPVSSPPGLRECAMRVIGPLGMGGKKELPASEHIVKDLHSFGKVLESKVPYVHVILHEVQQTWL